MRPVLFCFSIYISILCILDTMPPLTRLPSRILPRVPFSYQRNIDILSRAHAPPSSKDPLVLMATHHPGSQAIPIPGPPAPPPPAPAPPPHYPFWGFATPIEFPIPGPPPGPPPPQDPRQGFGRRAEIRIPVPPPPPAPANPGLPTFPWGGAWLRLLQRCLATF
jgi:hypothetical protein